MKTQRGHSLLLVVLLLGMVAVSALASSCAGADEDPFMHFLESTPVETLLSAEEQAELLQTYENEFAYLQQQYGEPIRTVSESVIGRIKAGAVSFAGSDAYAFDALLEQIGALRFEKAVVAFNSGDAETIHAHAGQLEVRNAVRMTVVPYGALKAKHDIDITSGGMQIQPAEVEIGIEAGEMLGNYKISTPVNASTSRSIMGPADFTEVKPGVYATHRAGYAVLFGRIERYTYDLYYSSTGKLHSHNECYAVCDESAEYCAFLASYGVPTYLCHAESDHCFTFASRRSCIDSICESPENYIG